MDSTSSVVGIQSSEAKGYADRYKALSRKGAEAIVDMGMVVDDAKRELDQAGFNAFVELVGLNGKTSTVRKFLQIGKMGPVLMEHIEKLPDNWTTIYQLTQLDELSLKQFLSSALATPDLKARDVPAVESPVRAAKKASSIRNTEAKEEGLAFRVQFVAAPPSREMIAELEQRIQKVIDELNLECRLIQSDALVSLFDQPIFAVAA